MFLAKPGEYPACGLFSVGHIMAVLVLLLIAGVALFFCRKLSRATIKKIIAVSAIVFIVLEILKIIYRVLTVGVNQVNTWVPLYYCSIMIYASVLAGFFKGYAEEIGLSFLSTGGIVGGFCFLIMPTTSLPEFPLFHFLSLHSLIYHAYFLFLGFLIIINNYFVPKFSHFYKYIILTGGVTIIAYIVNKIFNGNLMFLERPFNLNILEIINNFSHILYFIIFIFVQVIAPFILMVLLIKLFEWAKQKIINKKQDKLEVE